MAAPKVSVLMPVYNGDRFIHQAVDSVLKQTFSDFELLVVDDGSTDGTRAFLYLYAQADQRVKVIEQQHEGTRAALNRGLENARGQYLARLDADDVALPQRLEKQIALMDSCPELVVSGSNYQVIDEQGERLSLAQMPEHDTEIRWHALFHSPFSNSSVIFRLETLRIHGLRYAQQAVHVEDYDLWSRLLEYGQGANLSEPLACYRQHGQQVTQTGRPEQWANACLVAQRNLAKLGIALPIEQVSELRRWYYTYPAAYSLSDIPLCQALVQSLQAFSVQPGLNRRVLGRIRGRWLLKAFFTPCAPGMGRGWKRALWSYLQVGDLWAVASYLVYRRRMMMKA